MITIGLIGHSAWSANLGVGALTVSEIAILRDIARRLDVEIRIVILDWKQSAPSYVSCSNITIREMTGKTLISPSGYFAMLRACDLIIDIGGGDSFADIYGPKRIRRMFWMKYLVHLGRRPLVLAPQTYGPFSRPLSVKLARGSLRRAALVASRDEMSTEAVRALCPDVEVVEASDVALRLPYEPPPAGAAGGPVRVGLNVSGLLMSGGYTGDNMFGLSLDYPAMIRRLITRFLDHAEDCEVHLLPHVALAEGAGVEDDRIAALALQEEFPALRVAPLFSTPSEAKSYIATLDFFSGARMHACIAAFSSDVPVIPMAYSRKFSGLFGSLGYNRTVDCTTETGEAIVEKVIAGFEERVTLQEEQRPALALGLQKLARYEQALESIVARLARRGRRAL